MRPLFAVVLLATVAPAAPVPKALKRADDPTRLVGSWTVVSDDGRVGDERYILTMTFHREGGMRTTYNTSKPVEWELTFDADATPKKVRWYCPISKTTWDCLYELSDDTLRVGIITAKADPPPKLEKGPGCYLMELTRDKLAK